MTRVLAAGLALASLTVGFGAIDLLSPWLVHEGTQVSDVGYGTLAGIVIPVGLLERLRGQLAAAALALLLAGLLATEGAFVVAAGVVAVAAATAGPVGMRGGASPRLTILALLACGPCAWYAAQMAANQRRHMPPIDAHLGLGAWGALAAAALATLFTALVAARRNARGPALSVSAAVLAWAAACLAYPHSAGAVGVTAALLAAVWAAAFAAAASVRVSRFTETQRGAGTSPTDPCRRRGLRPRARRPPGRRSRR